MSEVFDHAVESSGRELSDLQRIWHVRGTIGHKDSNNPASPSARQWAKSLSDLALTYGIDTFLWMESEQAEGAEEVTDSEEQLERFAHEVVPLTRELIELAPGVVITSGISRSYQGAAASGPTRAEEETDNVDWVDETSMGSFPASDPPASSSFT